MIRLAIWALLLACWPALAAAAPFAVVRTPAPLLNTPDFRGTFGGSDGTRLKTDRCGQPRTLEFIALPDSVFQVLGESRQGSLRILRVASSEYPAPPGGSLYLDSRFAELRDSRPPERPRRLPQLAEITGRLRGALGTPYLWGGNIRDGVAQIQEWYFPAATGNDKSTLGLAGLDCSGLLYQATDGWTPRNTSQLVSFGHGVAIAGKSADQIAALLRPLDLIVWNGHVIMVLDRTTAIESRLECGRPGRGGVVATPLSRRLQEIMRSRRPADSWEADNRQGGRFVVRRWYPPQDQTAAGVGVP